MANERRARGLTPPLVGVGAIAPAGIVVGLLVLAAIGYAFAQSVGLLPLTGRSDLSLKAYREVLGGDASGELWSSLLLTLWVAAASTALAVITALAAVVWLDRPRARRRGLAAGLLHMNLAIPHVVWAVALLLLLAQTGLVARGAAAIGLINSPSGFPLVVNDRFGVGVIIHYATKEAPFLALIGLTLSRSQPRELRHVAETLGARGWCRARLVTLPVILPGVLAAAAVVFVFVVGAFEAPTLLGVSSPRVLSVLGLDLFNDSDLTVRPRAMALAVLMTIGVVAVAAVSAALARRRWR